MKSVSESSVMKKLVKLHKSGGVYAVIVSSENYNDLNGKIIKYLVKKERLKGIYVSLNKPHDIVDDSLKSEKVNTKSVFYVDAASSDKKSCSADRCICLQNGKSLTELSHAISNAYLKDKYNFCFLDSLSTLLVYNSKNTTEKFLHYIINKIRSTGLMLVVVSIDEKNSNELLPIISQFCDGVIRL